MLKYLAGNELTPNVELWDSDGNVLEEIDLKCIRNFIPENDEWSQPAPIENVYLFGNCMAVNTNGGYYCIFKKRPQDMTNWY